jgi:hypothetical protein
MVVDLFPYEQIIPGALTYRDTSTVTAGFPTSLFERGKCLAVIH